MSSVWEVSRKPTIDFSCSYLEFNMYGQQHTGDVNKVKFLESYGYDFKKYHTCDSEDQQQQDELEWKIRCLKEIDLAWLVKLTVNEMYKAYQRG